MYRCEVWIDNCGLSYAYLKEIDPSILNKNYRLCSMHFEHNMFRNEQQNRLKPDAVPTLFEKQTVENVADDDYETVEDCLPSCSTPGMFLIK